MKDKVLISRRQWSLEKVEQTARMENVEGIVLGDHFCQKRMFVNAELDVPETAVLAHELGLDVFYQTTVYVTSRVWLSELFMLEKLKSIDALQGVFVHDMGLLDRIRAWDVPICWDRFGFGRDHAPTNLSFIEFLKDNGVTAVELLNPKQIKSAVQAGVQALYRAEEPHLASFGRKCYTESVLNIVCETSPLCHGRPVALSATEGRSQDYIVDGFNVWMNAPNTSCVDKINPVAQELAWKIVINAEPLHLSMTAELHHSETNVTFYDHA